MLISILEVPPIPYNQNENKFVSEKRVNIPDDKIGELAVNI
ncbi:hypothetical protein IEU_01956 [Bacillus mycoides]|nr:hypothetical protein IEW_01953 [Bacillus mycoides]EJQ63196.1 hypothetical protein IEY_03379 [Bacillus mycoides]EJV68967.1 hypothetical protein IEU_01956 [Bacillus mycoides]